MKRKSRSSIHKVGINLNHNDSEWGLLQGEMYLKMTDNEHWQELRSWQIDKQYFRSQSDEVSLVYYSGFPDKVDQLNDRDMIHRASRWPFFNKLYCNMQHPPGSRGQIKPHFNDRFPPPTFRGTEGPLCSHVAWTRYALWDGDGGP